MQRNYENEVGGEGSNVVERRRCREVGGGNIRLMRRKSREK
jgi:hypothetical protein